MEDVFRSSGRDILLKHGSATMGLLSKRTGQNLIEYTLVVVIISAAVSAMSTYVYRAIQAKQQEIQAGSQLGQE
jgi:Flp pilus assembly pilin Flp